MVKTALRASRSSAGPLILFSTSMFLSAALLFVLEPMIGKMLLPLLGGTPAVWNTCLVFFQAMLLAGYLYAHAALKFLGRKLQIGMHLTLVLLPLLIAGLLPPHVPAGWEPPTESNPVAWVLLLLLVVIGLPFLALSATTSIMQSWFADSGRADAKDPYFLYAASNAGSLLGLFAYPLVLEPLLGLTTLSRMWSGIYAAFVAMTALCGVMAWRWRARDGGAGAVATTQVLNASGETEGVAWATRWRWIAIAFIPSSLMLGVTTAITANVPAIPLFWVLTLGVYLASFVLVFAKRPLISHKWIVARLPFLILCGMLPTVSQGTFSLPILLLLYLTVLFGIALAFHGELARSRPPVRGLTEFYLCLSIGGVLGGTFNSLIAPVVFKTVMELPLVLIFAALMRPALDDEGRRGAWDRKWDWLLPAALGVSTAAFIEGTAYAGIKGGGIEAKVLFACSMLWCLSFDKHWARFALGVMAIFAASWLYAPYGHLLEVERSFFGVYSVRNSDNGQFRLLFHGSIEHGIQSLDPQTTREPLAYYTRSGPVGALFRVVQEKMPHGNWAIVGLGAGAMACFVKPGQTLTYYEIDPLVAKIAEDTRYFTLLSKCDPKAKIVLGDARLKLQKAPDSRYGMIALDAFSGDSIPMHLMTREALALYLKKLAPRGLLAFHVSNFYFNLVPTLGDLAGDAHLAALVAYDTNVSQAELDAGKLPSIWVVIARDLSDLAPLLAVPNPRFGWDRLYARSGARVWTDDYSNLLNVVTFTR